VAELLLGLRHGQCDHRGGHPLGGWALLDLLDEIAERVQGGAFLLCPARPDLTDRRPDWGGGRRSFSSVFLDPLPTEETSRLLDLLLTVADLPRTLHERIVERAEGNPFFVEEIIRHLIDQGRIMPARMAGALMLPD
jgi:predicted ATPase